MYKIYIISILYLFIACQSTDKPSPAMEGVYLDWHISEVDMSKYRSDIRMVLRNETDKSFAAGDWSLYYNQMAGSVDAASLPKGLDARRINGEYHVINSLNTWAIPARDSLVIVYQLRGIAGRECMGPVGAFIHEESSNSQYPIETKVIWQGLVNKERFGIPTTQSRYEEYSDQRLLDKKDVSWIVPTPHSLTSAEGLGLAIAGEYSYLLPQAFSSISGVVETLFSNEGIATLRQVNANPSISVIQDTELSSEQYELEINGGIIRIKAGDRAGAFYAFQSLAQVMYHANREGMQNLPFIYVKDKPRFEYRGLHLDIGRNYFDVAKVKQLIDFMALFKLNKFHFNVTEDEGWRLEIPDLPELTEVGSRRGFTKDESDRLNPAYGSGPDVNNPRGTGYFTRQEFIDLLIYAQERSIEVIPEINAPAHARAAIISMKARYEKYRNQGDMAKAEEYLLHDPDDKSEYLSAQQFNDNVICVCRESAFVFVQKLVDEIALMYQEAGVPMNIFHAGGDEIPYGAWQKSPMCDQFLRNNKEVSTTDGLHAYYIKRLLQMLKKYNTRVGGWEEVVLLHGPDGHNSIDINTGFVTDRVLPYVWNASWGSGREDMVYKLANIGYDVVMSNSSAYYFDMTNDRDPENFGLNWSGYTSYKDMWSTEPLDIFKLGKTDSGGSILTDEELAKKVRLRPDAQKRFLGIQAQLWTETIRSEAIFDEMMMPNLPIFAQNAWSQPSQWIDNTERTQQQFDLDNAWNMFANAIGQRVLPIMTDLFGGMESELPKPGAIIKDGKLYANSLFPGMVIRYTTDGSIPDANSPIYSNEVEVKADARIKLRSFDHKGRGGRISSIE